MFLLQFEKNNTIICVKSKIYYMFGGKKCTDRVYSSWNIVKIRLDLLLKTSKKALKASKIH